jgi:hypothetical protein
MQLSTNTDASLMSQRGQHETDKSGEGREALDAATAVVEMQLPGEQVPDARPDSQGPAEGNQEANVRSPRRTLGSRVYEGTVLTIIVTVEVTWLVLLGYGLYSLL